MAGFQWGLVRDYDLVLNLDGDLSHNPRDIPTLMNASAQSELVLGSRYLNCI